MLTGGTTMMQPLRLRLWIVLLAFVTLGSVIGMPYVLLRNKAAKCYKLEHIRPHTTIRVHYHAPDLVNVTQEPEPAVPAVDKPIENAAVQTDFQNDGIDARYLERDRKRAEMMKTSRMKDINIMVQQRIDDPRSMVPDPKKQNITPRPPTNKVRVQVENRTGDLYFRTDDNGNSVVEICVQSYFASQDDPSRVGLNITTSDDSAEHEEKAQPSLTPEQVQQIQESNRIIRSQTSGITQELLKLEKKVKDIMSDINRSSKQATEVQEKALALNKAVRYWPMFRVVVLILGGYFQVSAVLNYMKRRHIH